jgi:glycosyltransferase involved in cell wall biosynthesis
MSRVAVYDRFWSTGGGGERYAGGIAEALASEHEVTLVSPEPIDIPWLEERLGVDLGRCAVQVVDPCAPSEVWSAAYDLFVNVSYRSHDRNGAAHGLFVVHFPDDPLERMAPWQRRLRAAGRHLPHRRTDRVRVTGGFHEADVIRLDEVRWTDGAGRLEVDLDAAERGVLHLSLGRFLPTSEPKRVTIEVDGTVVHEVTVDPAAGRLGRFSRLVPLRVDVPVAAAPGGAEVVVRSDVDVPAEVLGNGDRRRLGVPVLGVALSRPGERRRRLWGSIAAMDPDPLSWLATYDRVAANSGFTRSWTRRLWGVDSVVLHPAAEARVADGPKERTILSVGRFFGAERGHSKKQLELVRAFRRLCRGGVDDWRLELVGGCSDDDRPYLDAVLKEADGLPVGVHVDASGAELSDLYRRASLYWHGTGLGEDTDADPVLAEHFGITTVEAMSAGLVPVVPAAGGQIEVIEPGVSGFAVADEGALVERTLWLIEHPTEMAEMSVAARRRAEHFAPAAFGTRVRSLADDILGRDRP